MSETTYVRWLGHATVLLNQADTWVLTDPLLRGRVAHLRRRYPLLPEDWPERVDAVLISHLHQDHLDLPSLRRLGPNKLLLVPEGAGEWLEGQGFQNVQELVVGDHRQIERMRITAVPAVHNGKRPPFGPTADTVGYMIESGHTVYFAGDTDLFDGMTNLAESVDLALIPVWGWGRTLGTGHLDPLRAAEAIKRIQPQIAIPIHWGTYHPIGARLWRPDFLVQPPKIFAAAAQTSSPETDIRILTPGEETTIG